MTEPGCIQAQALEQLPATRKGRTRWPIPAASTCPIPAASTRPSCPGPGAVPDLGFTQRDVPDDGRDVWDARQGKAPRASHTSQPWSPVQSSGVVAEVPGQQAVQRVARSPAMRRLRMSWPTPPPRSTFCRMLPSVAAPYQAAPKKPITTYTPPANTARERQRHKAARGGGEGHVGLDQGMLIRG